MAGRYVPKSPLARRTGFAVWFFACISIIAWSGCTPTEPPKVNVVLVSLDTLRADHLGAYGYHRETSPSFDALAKESVLFERAISQAPATLASHRSLFRSRLPSHPLDGAPALAEVFSRAGYQTAGFTGGGNVSAKFGLGDGFDRYEEVPEGIGVGFSDLETWVKENADNPFFLFVHTYDIHHPYDPPAPYDTFFFPEYDGAVTGGNSRATLLKMRRLAEFENFEGTVELSADDRKKIVALYDGGILYTDQFLGRLISLLRELGIWDHTLLVVFSDHGEEFWEHGSVLHSHTLYDELLHVPLLIHLPKGQRGGQRVPAEVRLLDVAPTVLELADLEAPSQTQGTSLVPLVRGEVSRVPAGMAQSGTQEALIDYPWKLIQSRPGTQPTSPPLLYDLSKDPGEQTNLALSQPQVLARLQKDMAEIVGHEAPVPVRIVEPERADPELIQQLKALGYIDD